MLDKRRLLTLIEATGRAPQAHESLVNGVVLVDRSRDDRVVRRDRQFHRLRRLRLRDARDLVLELAHSGAERPADFRQALRPEEQKGKNEKENDLHRTDIRHAVTLPGFAE